MSERVAWSDVLIVEPAVVDQKSFVKRLLRHNSIRIIEDLSARTVIF